MSLDGNQSPHLEILCADDDPLQRKMLAFLLKKLGYEADFVCCGNDVISHWQVRSYDLVILDIEMSPGNGLETLRTLRTELGYHGAAIAVTGRETAEEQKACLDAGFDEVVVKPINLGLIADAISHLRARKITDDVTSISDTTLPSDETAHEATFRYYDREHSLSRVCGDHDFLAEMIGLFLEGLEQQLGELRESVQSVDSERVGDAAHAVKGAIASFTLSRPYELARQLEFAGRERQIGIYRDLLQELDQSVLVLVKELIAEQKRLQADLKIKTPD